MNLRNCAEGDVALEEAVEGFNALELKLYVRIFCKAGVNEPFAAVDNKVHSDLSLGNFRVEAADLNNGVSVFKLFCKRRNVGRYDLYKRKSGVQKNLV